MWTYQYSKDDTEDKTEYKVPYSILASDVAPIEDKERYEAYVRELTHEPQDNSDLSKERKKRVFKTNDLLHSLVKMPFDAILTTNYTYEIEEAQMKGYSELSSKRKRDLSAYYSTSKKSASLMLST